MVSPAPHPRVPVPDERAPGSVVNEAPSSPPSRSRSTASSRKGVVGWTLYDFGDTIFQQNLTSNYFPIWVVAVMGGSDGMISAANTVTMALMLGIGPWLGAVSDRMPRRMPILIASAVACCLLTFFIGSGLLTSLVLFVSAYIFFQAGVVIYDALLPAVSTPENRGRISGTASGLSNLGSLLGIGIGFVVLRAGGDYQTIFRLTAVAFLLLALPCFFWVKEPRREVERVAPVAVARAAWRDVIGTARRARSYPDLVRFLVGRAFYAEAANTVALFLGVYLTVQLGFSSAQKDLLLLIGISAALVGGIFWGHVVDRIGPRDSLMRVLAIWSLALALVAATGFLILPDEALWLIAPLAGFALGGIWASDRPLMIGLAPPEYLGQFYGLYALAGRFAALLGPLIWALIVDILGLGRPIALTVLLGFVLIAMVILRPLSPAVGRAGG